MIKLSRRLLPLLLVATLGCRTTTPSAPAPAAPPTAGGEAAAEVLAPTAEPVRLTILQLNDVYEITPIAGGQSGGLARVATLLAQLRHDNPHTLAVLAGDLLSPSALGTARVDGKRLDGQQMVAVLNRLGLDLAVLGNHELDLGEEALRARLGESSFGWLGANVRATGAALPVSPSRTIELGGATVAIVGVVTRENDPAYVEIGDPVAAAAAEVARLRPEADLVVALTHLDLDEDRELVRRVPGIDLVLGGHEHDNQQAWHEGAPIFKADANARTVWVHELWVTPGARPTGLVRGHSRPVAIGPGVAEDPAVAAEVASWVERAYAAFRADGFEPTEVVGKTPFSLDGRDGSVRLGRTRLSELLAEAFRDAADGAVAALYNSGSIRIDDVLPAGPLTQYDVIRILPYGGELWTVEVRGDLLRQVLDLGLELAGTGGYLQTTGFERDEHGTWHVGDEPLRDDVTYRVATGDYLGSGRQSGLEIFTTDDPRLRVVGRHGDVRQAVIAYLERRYPSSADEAREAVQPRVLMRTVAAAGR